MTDIDNPGEELFEDNSEMPEEILEDVDDEKIEDAVVAPSVFPAKKINYLNNKDMLKEIHKSKNTFCEYIEPARLLSKEMLPFTKLILKLFPDNVLGALDIITPFWNDVDGFIQNLTSNDEVKSKLDEYGADRWLA